MEAQNTLLILFRKWKQRRQWHPTPVLLPRKSHGRRSLVSCSPLATTEQLHFPFSLSCIGEGGNGNPLQCSCLENHRDGGAWWAAVYGVTQSQTRLKRLSNSSMELTLQVPMQYCSSQHQTLSLSPVTPTTGCCFCFGSVSYFFLELFLQSSSLAYLISVSYLLALHTVHGILKARMLKWFAISFFSGPRFVRTLQHISLRWPYMAWLRVSLS